jgi:hypothetical protein
VAEIKLLQELLVHYPEGLEQLHLRLHPKAFLSTDIATARGGALAVPQEHSEILV